MHDPKLVEALAAWRMYDRCGAECDPFPCASCRVEAERFLTDHRIVQLPEGWVGMDWATLRGWSHDT